MRNLAIIAFLTLVLAACNQEEASAPPAETNDSTQSSEPQAENENPATADDGGGAMDGAADQQASQPAASPAPANLSQVSQDAIDGCIDTLRAQQGAIGGTVTSTEFSEANSLVMLQDGNGAQWRCLVSNDGSNATVEAVGGAPAEENPVTADDGGGAMDGAADQQASQPAASPAPANLSQVSQDAIDGCIDTLRAQQGAIGGTVTSTEFSEANSLVMLQDGNGAQWRCLVSNDGSNATVEAVGGAPAEENPATADDGGGAMDGAGMPAVGSPTDVTAFQGARGGQAEGGLQALGFEAIRSEGLTTFWFNRSSGACARITTSEGVYSEVVMLPAEDC